MTSELVKKAYSEGSEKEWERLVRDPWSQLEFDTAMHFLKKYLPKKGLILDAGGGPGRYTIKLAKMGYNVVLLDLTPELLEIAKTEIAKAKVQSKVKQIIEGSILDLSMFEDNNFDAVTCLGGPLSHILDKKQREKAIDELIRVAKKNAPIFVSVYGRLALCILATHYLWQDMLTSPDIFKRYAIKGDDFSLEDFKSSQDFFKKKRIRNLSHFYLPEELKNEFIDRIKVMEMVGLHGIFTPYHERYNEVYKLRKYNTILWETHLKTCTHPSIVGISAHMMIICKK